MASVSAAPSKEVLTELPSVQLELPSPSANQAAAVEEADTNSPTIPFSLPDFQAGLWKKVRWKALTALPDVQTPQSTWYRELEEDAKSVGCVQSFHILRILEKAKTEGGMSKQDEILRKFFDDLPDLIRKEKIRCSFIEFSCFYKHCAKQLAESADSSLLRKLLFIDSGEPDVVQKESLETAVAAWNCPSYSEGKWGMIDDSMWSMIHEEEALLMESSENNGKHHENFPPQFWRRKLLPHFQLLQPVTRAPWEIAKMEDLATFDAKLEDFEQEVFWFCTLSAYWPFRTWLLREKVPRLRETDDFRDQIPADLELQMWVLPEKGLSSEQVEHWVIEFFQLEESVRAELRFPFPHPAKERVLALLREQFWGENGTGMDGLVRTLHELNSQEPLSLKQKDAPFMAKNPSLLIADSLATSSGEHLLDDAVLLAGLEPAPGVSLEENLSQAVRRDSLSLNSQAQVASNLGSQELVGGSQLNSQFPASQLSMNSQLGGRAPRGLGRKKYSQQSHSQEPVKVRREREKRKVSKKKSGSPGLKNEGIPKNAALEEQLQKKTEVTREKKNWTALAAEALQDDSQLEKSEILVTKLDGLELGSGGSDKQEEGDKAVEKLLTPIAKKAKDVINKDEEDKAKEESILNDFPNLSGISLIEEASKGPFSMSENSKKLLEANPKTTDALCDVSQQPQEPPPSPRPLLDNRDRSESSFLNSSFASSAGDPEPSAWQRGMIRRGRLPLIKFPPSKTQSQKPSQQQVVETFPEIALSLLETQGNQQSGGAQEETAASGEAAVTPGVGTTIFEAGVTAGEFTPGPSDAGVTPNDGHGVTPTNTAGVTPAETAEEAAGGGGDNFSTTPAIAGEATSSKEEKVPRASRKMASKKNPKLPAQSSEDEIDIPPELNPTPAQLDSQPDPSQDSAVQNNKPLKPLIRQRTDPDPDEEDSEEEGSIRCHICLSKSCDPMAPLVKCAGPCGHWYHPFRCHEPSLTCVTALPSASKDRHDARQKA